MTTSRTIVLSTVLNLALPTAKAMAADGWGASWSFGPVHPTATNHIIYTKTTMVPGHLPVSYWSSSSVGPLFLWPGLSNPTSDLIQTTMDAWSGSENSSYCSSNGSQWCVEASVFNGGQINGPSVAIDPDDHVTIEYQLGTDNNTWTQTVTSQKLGKVVSTLQSKSGLMLGGGFGFATEADADSFTADTAYYLCTEIHLAAADPAFGATGVGGVGANHGATGTGSGIGTAKNLRTPDNGLTWLVDLITLPAMNPQGIQTPAPSYSCSDTGGTSGTGGAPGTGGARTGGASSTGGLAATGGARTGGASSTGGRSSTGGASTGGAPNTAVGGTIATGGKPSTGGNPTTGGLNGIGGNPMTGGQPNTGGNVNVVTGGTPSTGGLVGNGGSGAMANTGGKSNTSVSTTSALGGSNTLAGGGNSAGASVQGNAGQSALASKSGTSPSSVDNAGSCSCSVPGKNAPRGLFALALAGVALVLRDRRRVTADLRGHG